MNHSRNCIYVMSFYTKWPRVSDGKVLGERWSSAVDARGAVGGERSARSRDVTFFSGAGRRWAPEDAVVRGSSLTPALPRAPLAPARAPRWRNAAVSAARPSVCRAALRPGHHARRAQATSVLITWRFPFLCSGSEL